MELKFIAMGLAVFGMAAAALGVSKVFSSMLEGLARNPESEDKLRKYVYPGAAFVEMMGILSFILAVLIIIFY